ncbi:unnamed protein product [Paramecium octaurelia]|uniref:Uncharacterized protein n=1 Tax=Paramecium octaurelia TaxID=43137 RepID=A0A8S1U8B9_PAROT|nr:unnamed protein product [Paramecium octaurelia]
MIREYYNKCQKNKFQFQDLTLQLCISMTLRNISFQIRARESFVYKCSTNKSYLSMKLKHQSKESIQNNERIGKSKNIDDWNNQRNAFIKRINLKAITLHEFYIIKQEFIQIITNTQFNQENQQGKEDQLLHLKIIEIYKRIMHRQNQ